MMSPTVSPSPNRSLPPRLHEMGGKRFEHLCRALLDKEPHLSNVDFYEIDGKRQFGIDIIGHRHDGSGVEVASCKCYAKTVPSEIKRFSDEFLEHLATHWKDWKVRRFVLAIAADTSRGTIQEAIRGEVERFEALGIHYQVWNPAKLQELLRPHPGIVSQYLEPGEYWVGLICGRSEPVEAPGSNPATLVDAAVVVQLATLQAKLAERASARVEQALERIRSGERQAVVTELTAIRNDAVEWSSLMPDVRARLLRLLASCRLEDDDLSEAEALADEADIICPSEEPRLRALIALYRDSNEAALSILGDPTTLDGANLKVAMMLDALDLDGAERILKEHPLLQAPDAETWRLRAHLHFEQNDRDAAVAAIREAERLKPDWPRVRGDGGRLRYAAAVSGALRPAMLRVPNPVDIDLVKEDVASQRLLEEALSAFSYVLERSIEDGRTSNETWRLAVLSARRDWSNEAATYARLLLQHDPTHWGAVAWSLARGFPINKEAALTAIESRLADQTAEPPHMAAALMLRLSDDDTADALRLFDTYSGQFESESGKALMAQWGERFHADGNAETGDRALSLRLGDAIERARQTSDWSPVASLLAALSKDDVGLVLPICQSLATAGRWDDIAPHINVLTGVIATAEAVRLGCYAAYYSGDMKQALTLIGRYPEFVANGELPVDLRRMEIAALWANGDIVTALERSEKLRTATADPHDTVREANLAFAIGDVKRAETLIGRPEIIAALPARTALAWADRLKPRSPERAARLLRHAIDKGVRREDIPTAFTLALHLPDPDIVRRIAPAFGSLAQESEGASLVRSFSEDEIATFVKENREDAERLSRLYNEGKTPPHFVSARLRANFAHLYLRSGDEDMAMPFRRRLSPLWIRHGARPAVTLPESGIFASALYVDISSLLLAEGIGLLDVLNDAGIAFHCPNTLPQAVAELESHACDHQPDIVAAHLRVRQALASGSVTVRDDDNSMDTAENHVWRVVHDREASTDEATTIDEQGTSVLPLSVLRAALHATGRIEGAASNAEPSPLETCPTSGDTLFFEYNTIASLIDAGLFDAAVGYFRIEIERRYLAHVEAELAAHDRNLDLARRLMLLRERAAQKIQSGEWRLAPHREIEDRVKLQDSTTAVERCLLDLLHIPADEEAIVWIDDRFVSRHASTETHPFIGITDVLAALRTAKHIDDERYFRFLIKLRRSRAHFLPITPEEVLHHLRHAGVRDNAIIETPELATLRQHFADALLMEECWDLPEPSERNGDHRELNLVLGFYRLFDQVMIPIWTAKNADLIHRTAWLDWAWSSLRTHCFDRLPLDGESGAKQRFLAVNLASLFHSVIMLIDVDNEPQQQPCRDLIRWLDSRVFQPALHANHISARQIAQLVADLITTHFSGDDEDDSIRQVILLVVQRFIRMLPNELRQVFYEMDDFIGRFEINLVSTINFHGITFNNNAFWTAVARARGGRKAKLTSWDGKSKVTLFRPKRGKLNEIQVGGDLDFRLAESPELALVGGSYTSRRRMLEKHPEWFDLPPSGCAVTIAEIADAPTPAERMKRLADHQEHSVPYRLARWINGIREREAVELSAPTPTDLLRHLRLDLASDDPATALGCAAERLTSELGVPEAMRRLAYLPIPLPLPVVDGLAMLELSERTRHLGRGAAGPLARLHWLRMLRRFDSPNFSAEVDRMLEDWEPRIEAFLAVLRWANGHLAENADWRALSGPNRLILTWLHAGLVTEALLGEGVTPAFILEHFRKTSPSPRLDLSLVTDRTYDDSTLFPSPLLDGASLLYHGMAMVVGMDGECLLTRAQRQRIEELLSFEHEERRHPNPSLYRDWRLFDDVFGSMFSMRPKGIFVDLPDITGAEAERVVLKSVIDVSKAPASAGAWVAYMVAGGVPAFESPEVLKILSTLDVTALSSLASGDGFALRMAAEATARSRDTEAIKRFAEGLFAGAAILSRRYRTPVYPPGPVEKSEHPAQTAAFHLLEALAQLSKRHDLSAATTFLADGLLKLADAWPSATPYWRRVAEGILDGLPFKPGTEMVRAWTVLRTGV